MMELSDGCSQHNMIKFPDSSWVCTHHAVSSDGQILHAACWHKEDSCGAVWGNDPKENVVSYDKHRPEQSARPVHELIAKWEDEYVTVSEEEIDNAKTRLLLNLNELMA